MSKLLARAKAKRENAEENYIKIGQDDAYLDETCFNLQQCVELCLKYMVEMRGEEYIENHDIRAQLNKLKAIDAEIPMEEELRSLAYTLNSWESESRYNDDFTALIEDIEAVRLVASKLVLYCDGLVEEL